jgi:16S rRNA processing protein RimM
MARLHPTPALRADPPPPGEGGGVSDLILLAEFGRAHGLKGEVRLKSFTADPRAVAAYGPLTAADGRTVVIKPTVRPAPGGAPDMLIVQVEGVTTREAAEALNRLRLFVERSRLPAPDEDEFLLADLIGLAVVSPAGEALGTVVDVPDYGGGDLLEIAPPGGGPTVLLPFTKAFVPVVDLPGRRIVADAPADLFEPAGGPPGDSA